MRPFHGRGQTDIAWPRAIARPRDPDDPNTLKFYLPPYAKHCFRLQQRRQGKIVSEHLPKTDQNQKRVSIIGSDYILIQTGLNLNLPPLLDLLEPLGGRSNQL